MTRAKVTAERPVSVAYYDEEGVHKSFLLDRSITPALVGGIFRVSLEEDDGVKLSTEWP